MSSILQQDVTIILQNNYLTLAMMIAVGYDYILTFPDEIEYIWNKPWTRVSTLYVVARYSGLCLVIMNCLTWSSFLSGSVKVYVFLLQHLVPIVVIFEQLIIFDSCEILNAFVLWTFTIFIGAADLAMILRVWRVYKNSILIHHALLVFYVITVVLRLISCVIFHAVKSMAPIVASFEVADFSICLFQVDSTLATWIAITVDIVQIILGGFMCLLVGVRFITQSLQMYKATKKFELGPYMSLFTREGLFYFLAMLSSALVNLLSYVPNFPWGGLSWWNILAPILQNVPVFALTPRLILTLRKLYARVEVLSKHGNDTSTPAPFSSMFSDRDEGGSFLFEATMEIGTVEQMEMARREIPIQAAGPSGVQANTTPLTHSRKSQETEQGEEVQMVERETPIAGPSRV